MFYHRDSLLRRLTLNLYAVGNWIGATSVPDDSLEQSEQNLEREDKAQFLAFMRKMVTWRPEDRCSAKELLTDAWLNKFE